MIRFTLILVKSISDILCYHYVISFPFHTSKLRKSYHSTKYLLIKFVNKQENIILTLYKGSLAWTLAW